MAKRTATCPECGTTFEARQRNQHYCSKRCRKRVEDRERRPVRDRGQRTCEWCRETFLARGLRQRFCGDTCRVAGRRAEQSTPIPWHQCSECTIWFIAHRGRVVCSRACGLIRGRRLFRETYVGVAATNPTVAHVCPECGAGFETNRYSAVRKFCSKECSTRANHRHRRHLERSAQRKGERFTLREIAERDGWRCHLCHRKVSQGQATLDHLDPLSLGGTHTRANVSLAHRKCNTERSNSGPAQLRLTG